MRAVGYRQAWDFWSVETKTLKTCRICSKKALFATRQLANQYSRLQDCCVSYVFNIYNTVNEGILDLRIRYR